MLHILLHRPFLAGGHLESLVGDKGQASLDICVNAALRIYSLARIYREVFTFRRATYLFSYAVFSAATILPMHGTLGQDPNKRMEVVIFFWNALKELQNGANCGLSKPIAIIKSMFERAGIDLTALASMQREQSQNAQDGDVADTGIVEPQYNLPILPDSGLDDLDNEKYRDLFTDMSMGVSDWGAYDMPDDGMNDELLYGLFRRETEADLNPPPMMFPN